MNIKSQGSDMQSKPDGAKASGHTQTECVYKYVLEIGDWISIVMPEGAQVLSVQVQAGVPHLWARVIAGRPPTVRHFRVAGTGHDLGSNVGRHIGSFQMCDGAYVFHVFEGATEPAA